MSRLICLLMAGLLAWGQDSRGTIGGRVADAQDGLLMGVKVTATNQETGVSAAATTNETGGFRLPFLAPGRYRVTAELSGFRTYAQSDVELRVSDQLDLRIRMDLGSVTETIEVKGGTPLLETGTSSLGQVMDSKRLEDLPQRGGNPLELQRLAPGVDDGPAGRRVSDRCEAWGARLPDWAIFYVGRGRAYVFTQVLADALGRPLEALALLGAVSIAWLDRGARRLVPLGVALVLGPLCMTQLQTIRYTVPALSLLALALSPSRPPALPLSRSRKTGGGNAKGSFRTWCRRLSPDDVCISSVAGLLVCPSGIRGCLPGARRTSCSSKRGRVVCVCQVSNCKHHFFSDTGGWVDEFVPLRKPRQSTARHPTT